MAKLSSLKQKTSSNDRIIRLIIGTVFVVMFAFRFSGTASGAMFSCFMGCNDRSPMFERFALVDGCFLLIAIITAIALYKKASWSVAVGLVLGLSYFVTIVLSLITFEKSFGQTLLFLFLPNNILVYIAIALVFRLARQNPFPTNFSSISIIGFLSILCTVLVVSGFTADEKLAPFFKADRQAEESKIKDQTVGGLHYVNEQYGFELTFPDDRKVYIDDSDPQLSINITFSNDGMHSPNSFSMEIHNMSIEQDTADNDTSEDIIRNTMRFEPTAKTSQVVINDIPFVRVDHLGGRSFSFITPHNKKIYHFTNYGGMSMERFMPILETLKFIAPVEANPASP